MKKVIRALKTTVIFAAILVLALVLAKGVKAEAAYGDKVTTPEGLILYEHTFGSVTGYSIVGYDSVKLTRKLIIPEYYNNIPILEIGLRAFKDCKILESVFIPASVRSLNKECFKGCTALESVEFGGNVGEWRQKTWPESGSDYLQVVGIGTSVFEDCTSLTSLELIYGWDCSNNYGMLANSGVRYVKLVIVDKPWQSLFGPSFSNCPELEKIDIIVKKKQPGIDLKQLGYDPKLKEINIYYEPEKEPFVMYSGIGVNFGEKDIEKNAIMNCPALEYVNIYVDSRAIGSQFSFFHFSFCKPEFEGDNVHRLPGELNASTFVIDGEGTAVFSAEKIPFKARLIVGSGDSKKKDIAECELTMPVEELPYTGSELLPYLYLQDGKTLLEEDKDYTVTVKDNKEIGAATVIITGTGDYNGTVSRTFSIVPTGTSVKNVKIGKKESTIVLNEYKPAGGYEIYYSSKKAKGYKKLYSGTDAMAKVTKLKSGMYIKIRTYKKVGKTTYYSEWSAPIQVK